MATIEYKRQRMDRSRKDSYLTLPSEIHTVNTRKPVRSFTVPPVEYSRHRNSIAGNGHGLFARQEVLGKRVVSRDKRAIFLHDDQSHLNAIPASNSNVHTGETSGVKINQYVNIAGIGDLANKVRMTNNGAMTGSELATESTKQFAKSAGSY